MTNIVIVVCPHCQETFSVSKTLTGMKTICPECNNTFRIKTQEDIARNNFEPETIKIRCTQCAQKIRVNRNTMKMRMTCPACHNEFYPRLPKFEIIPEQLESSPITKKDKDEEPIVSETQAFDPITLPETLEITNTVVNNKNNKNTPNRKIKILVAVLIFTLSTIGYLSYIKYDNYQKARLKEITTIKSQAEVAIKKLSVISPEYGFKKKLRKIKETFATAKIFFDNQSYKKASSDYRSVLVASVRIFNLDIKRNKALAIEVTMIQQQKLAINSKAKILATDIWSSAESFSIAGNKNLNNADFNSAINNYSKAIKFYKSAQEYAIKVHAVDVIKKRYNKILASVIISVLNRYGGYAWGKAKSLVLEANDEINKENWDIAYHKYNIAIRLLKQTIKNTHNTAKLERKRQLKIKYDNLMVAGNTALAQKSWDDAKIKFLKALQINGYSHDLMALTGIKTAARSAKKQKQCELIIRTAIKVANKFFAVAKNNMFPRKRRYEYAKKAWNSLSKRSILSALDEINIENKQTFLSLKSQINNLKSTLSKISSPKKVIVHKTPVFPLKLAAYILHSRYLFSAAGHSSDWYYGKKVTISGVVDINKIKTINSNSILSQKYTGKYIIPMLNGKIICLCSHMPSIHKGYEYPVAIETSGINYSNRTRSKFRSNKKSYVHKTWLD